MSYALPTEQLVRRQLSDGSSNGVPWPHHHHHAHSAPTNPEALLEEFPRLERSRDWMKINNLDSFLTDMYWYHLSGGYWPSIVEMISNICTIAFTIGFSTFLIVFVDWSSILRCSKERSKGSNGGSGDSNNSDRVCDGQNALRQEYPSLRDSWLACIVLLYILVFTLYLLWHVGSLLYSLRSLRRVREFFTSKLSIRDDELSTVDWSLIVDRIVALQLTDEMALCHNRKLDALDITNRIMRKENYLLALLQQRILKIDTPLINQRNLECVWHSLLDLNHHRKKRVDSNDDSVYNDDNGDSDNDNDGRRRYDADHPSSQAMSANTRYDDDDPSMSAHNPSSNQGNNHNRRRRKGLNRNPRYEMIEHQRSSVDDDRGGVGDSDNRSQKGRVLSKLRGKISNLATKSSNTSSQRIRKKKGYSRVIGRELSEGGRDASMLPSPPMMFSPRSDHSGGEEQENDGDDLSRDVDDEDEGLLDLSNSSLESNQSSTIDAEKTAALLNDDDDLIQNEDGDIIVGRNQVASEKSEMDVDSRLVFQDTEKVATIEMEMANSSGGSGIDSSLDHHNHEHHHHHHSGDYPLKQYNESNVVMYGINDNHPSIVTFYDYGYLGQILEWNLRLVINSWIFRDEQMIDDSKIEFYGSSSLLSESDNDNAHAQKGATQEHKHQLPASSNDKSSSFSVKNTRAIRSLQRIFVYLGLLNLCLLPFTLVFRIIFFFLKNAEQLRHTSSASGTKDSNHLSFRQWTPMARILMREWNELPHVMRVRLQQSHKPTLDYLGHFKSLVIGSISELVSYISGSFVAVLVVITLIDSSILINVELFERSLVWYLAVFSAVLASSRAVYSSSNPPPPSTTTTTNTIQTARIPVVGPSMKINDLMYDESDKFYGLSTAPELSMREVALTTHYFPDHWRFRCHLSSVRDELLSMYQTQLFIFLSEIWNVFCTPFILVFTCAKCSEDVIDFIAAYTDRIDGIGDVCSLARFDVGLIPTLMNHDADANADANGDDGHQQHHTGMMNNIHDNRNHPPFERQISDSSQTIHTDSTVMTDRLFDVSGSHRKSVVHHHSQQQQRVRQSGQKLESGLVSFAMNNPNWRGTVGQSALIESVATLNTHPHSSHHHRNPSGNRSSVVAVPSLPSRQLSAESQSESVGDSTLGMSLSAILSRQRAESTGHLGRSSLTNGTTNNNNGFLSPLVEAQQSITSVPPSPVIRLGDLYGNYQLMRASGMLGHSHVGIPALPSSSSAAAAAAATTLPSVMVGHSMRSDQQQRLGSGLHSHRMDDDENLDHGTAAVMGGADDLPDPPEEFLLSSTLGIERATSQASSGRGSLHFDSVEQPSHRVPISNELDEVPPPVEMSEQTSLSPDTF